MLVGLGTIVVGSGAALGTGAFSQVDANRSIDVNIEGDSSAYLGLSQAGDDNQFVTTTTEQEVATVDIDIGTDGEDGINANAETRFVELINITNNTDSTNGVDIRNIEFNYSGDDKDAITAIPENGFGSSSNQDPFPTENNTISDGATNSELLAPGETVAFGIAIDLQNHTLDTAGEVNASITITANGTDGV
ncbi:hypothetical protein ACFO3C_18115 [Halostagnicola sp. GCM10023398]|uniref:hypothetical protein n=1 Tax=unclassified Halostagnicola TaxID=2642439 RepID=UPI00361A3475